MTRKMWETTMPGKISLLTSLWLVRSKCKDYRIATNLKPFVMCDCCLRSGYEFDVQSQSFFPSKIWVNTFSLCGGIGRVVAIEIISGPGYPTSSSCVREHDPSPSFFVDVYVLVLAVTSHGSLFSFCFACRPIKPPPANKAQTKRPTQNRATRSESRDQEIWLGGEGSATLSPDTTR